MSGRAVMVAWCLLLTLCGGSRADVVHLKNGRTIQGLQQVSDLRAPLARAGTNVEALREAVVAIMLEVDAAERR